MIINIINKNLISSNEFLLSIPLKSVSSRARTKLCNALDSCIKEFVQSELDLAKEFSHTNENGNFLIDGEDGLVPCFDGRIKLKHETAREFQKQREIFLNEQNEVSMLDSHVESLLSALNDLDMDLQGEDAVTYDYICEVLESAV